ncbi:hypothetical protein QJQ45_028085 [Haematococcus lacustris]|nr:hypothetical protein QJQ45_028085 [Haematococcus lacustris]
MMHDAGMLGVLTEEGVNSLKKFRNGALPDPARPGNFIAGPRDSHVSAPCSQVLASPRVANRWDALLPDPRRQKLASPKHTFARIVHTDGVAISVMFLRPKPAAPPAELPRMGRGLGAVNPLAHLHAEWLGVDPGKTNMATVAHEERSAAGTVVSVKPQLTALSRVSSKPSSLASYRQFADTVLATYDAMWAEVSKQRWANAKFRLYCGKMRVVASFYDRDVSAALNIRRCAVGPGPRPTELCYWDGRPAMPKRGRPGQEWVYLPDKALLRKWRRKWRQ